MTKITKETKMGIIAKKYGIDFGTDNKTTVANYLKKKGHFTLASMLADRDSQAKKTHTLDTLSAM